MTLHSRDEPQSPLSHYEIDTRKQIIMKKRYLHDLLTQHTFLSQHSSPNYRTIDYAISSHLNSNQRQKSHFHINPHSTHKQQNLHIATTSNFTPPHSLCYNPSPHLTYPNLHPTLDHLHQPSPYTLSTSPYSHMRLHYFVQSHPSPTHTHTTSPPPPMPSPNAPNTP